VVYMFRIQVGSISEKVKVCPLFLLCLVHFSLILMIKFYACLGFGFSYEFFVFSFISFPSLRCCDASFQICKFSPVSHRRSVQSFCLAYDDTVQRVLWNAVSLLFLQTSFVSQSIHLHTETRRGRRLLIG